MRVRVAITEFYDLDVPDDSTGDDVIEMLDDMDSDDQAAHYDYRQARVTNVSKGTIMTNALEN